MKNIIKRFTQNTSTVRERETSKCVDTHPATKDIKYKEEEKREKVSMGNTNGTDDKKENFSYINSYLTSIFDLDKSDGSVSSKGDKIKGISKSNEFSDNLSRLHTKNNSLSMDWELDNTYESEVMENEIYQNGTSQSRTSKLEDPNVAYCRGATYSHPSDANNSHLTNHVNDLNLKKTHTSVDERDYNMFGSKSLFNNFGSFNRNDDVGFCSTKNEEMLSFSKYNNVQNEVCEKMYEEKEIPVDDSVNENNPSGRCENFGTLKDNLFPMITQEEITENNECQGIQLDKSTCSNDKSEVLEPGNTGKHYEMEKDVFDHGSSNNKEFICNYFGNNFESDEEESEEVLDEEKLEEELNMEKHDEALDAEKNGKKCKEEQNCPLLSGYIKGKSVHFDFTTSEDNNPLNDDSTQAYEMKSKNEKEDICAKLNNSGRNGDNILLCLEKIEENENHKTKGRLLRSEINEGDYKKDIYENNSSNGENMVFSTEMITEVQSETCLQGLSPEKKDIDENKYNNISSSSMLFPNNNILNSGQSSYIMHSTNNTFLDDWNYNFSKAGLNIKEYNNSDIYNNLLELLNDGTQNIGNDNINNELVIHTDEGIISEEKAAYYHGGILQHVTNERDETHGDGDRISNNYLSHQNNYNIMLDYANGMNSIHDAHTNDLNDNAMKFNELERGDTLGNNINSSLGGKNYLKYPSAPFANFYVSEQSALQNSTHHNIHRGTPIQNCVTKKKNVIFEALKNKIKFLLDNEDDELLLSEYIMDAINDYNRSKYVKKNGGSEGGDNNMATNRDLEENIKMDHHALKEDRIVEENNLGKNGFKNDNGIDVVKYAALQITQNSAHNNKTINFNSNGSNAGMREVGCSIGHSINLLSEKGRNEIYNDGYSNMNDNRSEVPQYCISGRDQNKSKGRELRERDGREREARKRELREREGREREARKRELREREERERGLRERESRRREQRGREPREREPRERESRENKFNKTKLQNGGNSNISNNTRKSNIANLKLFLTNSLVANKISNSREEGINVSSRCDEHYLNPNHSTGDGDVEILEPSSFSPMVELRTNNGNTISYINGHSSGRSNNDNSLLESNGGKMKNKQNEALVPNGNFPVKKLEKGKCENMNPFYCSSTNANGVKGFIENEDYNQLHMHKSDNSEEAQRKKIHENLFLLSRKNSGSRENGGVMDYKQNLLNYASQNGRMTIPSSSSILIETLEKDVTTPYEQYLQKESEYKKIFANTYANNRYGSVNNDNCLTPNEVNIFLKSKSVITPKSKNTCYNGVDSSTSRNACDVGVFEKGYFLNEWEENLACRNFNRDENRGEEEEQKEAMTFGGKRDSFFCDKGDDLFFIQKRKNLFSDSRKNSLWNRNITSRTSATRGSFSVHVNRSSFSVNRNNVRKGNPSCDYERTERPMSQERRMMSNSKSKKKSPGVRELISGEDLRALLSEEDEHNLEKLLNSLYDDRIIPLIINLKGRADEYNFRNILKNNIKNSYSLYTEKYIVKVNSSCADNCLVYFLDRKVDSDYFFSINDSEDRYDPKLWKQFEKYLREIADSEDPKLYSFSGGRYGMAKELQKRKLPFFEGLYLGHLCHIIHISATRKIIAYENNFIKPISQCRKYENARMGILNTRGQNMQNYISSIDELKFYLNDILKCYKRGINISTLKGKMISNYNKRLCESVFHCVKLVELLQMEELRDICVVDMESRMLKSVSMV
ncbi:hypothetical protein, conserved [Plasmodium gonderi]|uniref:HTH OST-type domain-containing protein n=1 Tax=Plasmodium gonderi TaxID=77519 RepID=A0A1Y1JL95_PLAGO|nr:hypothetical protein, conserved [Plasmodium gonderi]GAW83020.1 hypothetical protein, conserved [Plasmodium gonderi]